MKFIFALSLLSLSTFSFASVKIQEEIFVIGQRPDVVKELIQAGSVEIDHVTGQGFELYGPVGLMEYLDQKKIAYLDMTKFNDKAFADYPTFDQITAKMKELSLKYPTIMKLMSIGKSVKGRDLWVMKVSDNVNMEEVEPEFKYISSMHGDEITGRELTISLLEEMGQKYGSNAELTSLINNTEIYVMPSMNPDGSEAKRRGNANGVDLNRNFPDMTRDSQSSPTGREIENQHVMKFQGERQFSLSANFHGGTIVANYPWDAKYDLHPLNDFIRELSLGYAELNPEMRASTEFPLGVTNGAAWYVVKGGMQDWSYVWHNDLQITIELSHDKYPRYSEIPGFYLDNRDSMIYYMKEIHRGAGIKIARPGIKGTVAIKQVGPVMKDLGTFAFNNSEFYKVLPEGDYTFTVQEKVTLEPKIVNVRVEKGLIRLNGNYTNLN